MSCARLYARQIRHSALTLRRGDLRMVTSYNVISGAGNKRGTESEMRVEESKNCLSHNLFQGFLLRPGLTKCTSRTDWENQVLGLGRGRIHAIPKL